MWGPLAIGWRGFAPAGAGARLLLERVPDARIELRAGRAGARVVVIVVVVAVRRLHVERRDAVEHVDHRAEDLPVLESRVRRREVERRERRDRAVAEVGLQAVGQLLRLDRVHRADVAHDARHVPRALLPRERHVEAVLRDAGRARQHRRAVRARVLVLRAVVELAREVEHVRPLERRRERAVVLEVHPVARRHVDAVGALLEVVEERRRDGEQRARVRDARQGGRAVAQDQRVRERRRIVHDELRVGAVDHLLGLDVPVVERAAQAGHRLPDEADCPARRFLGLEVRIADRDHADVAGAAVRRRAGDRAADRVDHRREAVGGAVAGLVGTGRAEAGAVRAAQRELLDRVVLDPDLRRPVGAVVGVVVVAQRGGELEVLEQRRVQLAVHGGHVARRLRRRIAEADDVRRGRPRFRPDSSVPRGGTRRRARSRARRRRAS